MPKPPYWFCLGWWSPWCWADTLLCRTRLHWSWVCKRHDAALERRLYMEAYEEAEPVEVTGRPTVLVHENQTASNSTNGLTFRYDWSA